MDSLGSLALATDEPEDDFLNKIPETRKTKIITNVLIIYFLYYLIFYRKCGNILSFKLCIN